MSIEKIKRYLIKHVDDNYHNTKDFYELLFNYYLFKKGFRKLYIFENTSILISVPKHGHIIRSNIYFSKSKEDIYNIKHELYSDKKIGLLLGYINSSNDFCEYKTNLEYYVIINSYKIFLYGQKIQYQTENIIEKITEDIISIQNIIEYNIDFSIK